MGRPFLGFTWEDHEYLREVRADLLVVKSQLEKLLVAGDLFTLAYNLSQIKTQLDRMEDMMIVTQAEFDAEFAKFSASLNDFGTQVDAVVQAIADLEAKVVAGADFTSEMETLTANAAVLQGDRDKLVAAIPVPVGP